MILSHVCSLLNSLSIQPMDSYMPAAVTPTEGLYSTGIFTRPTGCTFLFLLVHVLSRGSGF